MAELKEVAVAITAREVTLIVTERIEQIDLGSCFLLELIDDWCNKGESVNE